VPSSKRAAPESTRQLGNLFLDLLCDGDAQHVLLFAGCEPRIQLGVRMKPFAPKVSRHNE